MENLVPEFALQLIIGLITLFGSLIVLLLGLIGFFVKRYVSQIDVRLREHDGDINQLQLGQIKHTTEIKNIHHRLKET